MTLLPSASADTIEECVYANYDRLRIYKNEVKAIHAGRRTCDYEFVIELSDYLYKISKTKMLGRKDAKTVSNPCIGESRSLDHMFVRMIKRQISSMSFGLGNIGRADECVLKGTEYHFDDTQGLVDGDEFV